MSTLSPACSPSNLLIRASAGTGKTFQLSTRYLQLVIAGVDPERILATTFTRKAAAEILERVILRLADATLDPSAAKDLACQLDVKSFDAAEARSVLTLLLRQLDRVRIATLDSFFSEVARMFSVELGLPSHWQIAQPQQENAMRDAAISDVLRAEQSRDLLNLTHLLTKGEAQRSVAQLVRETVGELHAVYGETSDQAWKCVPEPSPLSDEQLNAHLLRLKEAEHPNKHYQKAIVSNYASAAEGDWEAFLAKGISGSLAQGDGTYYGKPVPSELVAIYQPLIRHAKALFLTQLARQTEGARQLLGKYDVALYRRRRREALLRFADVPTELLALFHLRDQQPDDDSQLEMEDWITYRLDTCIDHVLLDEFQDTSPVQWRLIRRLVPSLERTDGRARSFFCVGDAKQAIYGWRGGEAEIFSAVSQTIAPLEQRQLDVSYRSAQPILATVNRVFLNLTSHSNLTHLTRPVACWQQHFAEHRPHSELSGYARLETAPRELDGFADEDAVLAAAAKQIAQEIVGQSPGSIGVLVRKNETVARLIYLLSRYGVRASEEGGNPLSRSVAVQLVLSLLWLADHPGDTAARFHVAHSPLSEAVGLQDWSDDQGAWHVARDIRRAIAQRGFGRTVSQWADKLIPACDGRERRKLQQLVERAFLYDDHPGLTLDEFVSFVNGQRVIDPSDSDIRVMTIHQAKGLEFETVVLPELGFQLGGQPPMFATRRSEPGGPVELVLRYVNQDLQLVLPDRLREACQAVTGRLVHESLCVLYVAMTRAKRDLRMIIPPASESERSMPKTMSGLLRATLTDDGDAPPDRVLFEAGVFPWATDEDAGRVRAVAAPVPRLLDRFQLSHTPSVPRYRSSRSPSSLEGGTLRTVHSILARPVRRAVVRGSLLHAWLQHVRWLDDDLPTRERLRDIAGQVLPASSPDGVSVDESVDEFLAMVTQDWLKPLLEREAYTKWAKEHFGLAGSVEVDLSNECPFVVTWKEHLLSGSIDRLVTVRQGDRVVAADVIDYKTDQIEATDSAALTQRTDHYRPQLRSYREAVCQLAELPPESVTARLVFLNARRVADV